MSIERNDLSYGEITSPDRLRLEKSPFIEGNLLIGYAKLGIIPRTTKKRVSIQAPLEHTVTGDHMTEDYYWLDSVPVDQIISSLGMQNWSDVFSSLPSAYVIKAKEDIAQRPFSFFMAKPSVLIDYEGAYIHIGIGTNIAIAKMADVEQIPALVIKTKLDGVVAVTEKDFGELKQRRSQGLWKGTLSKDPSGTNYANGKVKWSKGPWVFARDLKKARAVYLFDDWS